MGDAVLVASEVDHPRQFLRAALTRVDVMPDVFVDAECPHAGEAALRACEAFKDGPDGTPERLPRRSQLAGEAADGRVFAAELSDRPRDRAASDRSATGDELDMDAVKSEQQVASSTRIGALGSVRARGSIVKHV